VGNGGQGRWGIGVKSVGNRDQQGWGMRVKSMGNGDQSSTKNTCKIRVSLIHRRRSCCLKNLLFKKLVVKQQKEKTDSKADRGRT
jgi:hypothetical protein